MELDVNDPTTWPDTLEGLAALALDGNLSRSGPPPVEPTPPVRAHSSGRALLRSSPPPVSRRS